MATTAQTRLLITVLLTAAVLSQDFQQQALELTPSTFEKKVLENDQTISVVFFGAEWCGHCKNFKPTYTKIHTKYSGKTTKDAKYTVRFYTHFDAGEKREFLQRFDIKGYPTIIAIRGDGKWWEFNGARSEEGVMDWVNSLKVEAAKQFPAGLPHPAIQFINDFLKAIKHEYSNNPTLVVGVIGGSILLSLLISYVIITQVILKNPRFNPTITRITKVQQKDAPSKTNEEPSEKDEAEGLLSKKEK